MSDRMILRSLICVIQFTVDVDIQIELLLIIIFLMDTGIFILDEYFLDPMLTFMFFHELVEDGPLIFEIVLDTFHPLLRVLDFDGTIESI